MAPLKIIFWVVSAIVFLTDCSNKVVYEGLHDADEGWRIPVSKQPRLYIKKPPIG
jgi:hypothetical protein